ncbi:hypothetical protein BCD67_07610 [Oscillatoriales cyanobacterium USR001]|nr:hypothetical protein BCD67_07610 [Oscillatoriales cyanobacterium USR001]
MKPEVARKRIEAFERRFGRTHLIFACHGAFPLALTPDLLYKLWANFQRDIHGKVLGIPWVAVADLLLSSLCDEVGRELYEMDTAVRNLLLNRLKEDDNFGQLRINELSDFLLVYVGGQLQSNNQEVRDFAQAQRWTALAYVRPSEAAQELRLALERTYKQDKSEQLRLVSLIEAFAEPLPEFEPLLVYAREIGKFKRSDSAIAATGVSQELGQSSQVKTDDFSKEVLDGINPPFNKEPRENNFVRIQVRIQTVILTFGDGDFERGFPVTCQIWLGNERFPTQLQVTLPPTDVYSSYCNWQSYYQHLYHFSFSHRGLVRIEGYTNGSFTELRKLAQTLQNSINNWLKSESFRPLVDLLYRQLLSTDKIQVLIVTKNHFLQRLPWHLWEFFEYYPKAELAFGFLSTKIKQSTHSRNKVRIFALLGTGINVDVDINLIKQLPNTESVFLVESSRERLNDQLWDEQGWDIFYFGGLSSSDSDDNNGEIRLNSTDILTAEELKFSLKRAVERGLKLAIFNSCDGLGIANKLADLGSLTIIVMRGPLSDEVVQEFLKHFLSAFSSGQSLYASLRKARERLQALEDIYPFASWLPVIFQNPAEEPPTWQGFLNTTTDTNKE